METTSVLNIAIIGVMVALITRLVLSGSKRRSAEDVLRRLEGRAEGKKGSSKNTALVTPKKKRSIDGVAKVLAKPLQGSAYERNRLSLKLAQAGYRHERAVAIFLATKITLAVITLIGGLIVYKYHAPENAEWFQIMLYPLGGLCVGFFGTQLWLDRAARIRSEKISNALPDALDMLTIMVEAGLGLDAGIQRCAEEMRGPYPEIAEELTLAGRETQLGLKRSDAMTKMANRTGVKEMKALVTMMTQAERFGTSIARGLRVHAEALRIKRRQKAEETAGKVATKLIFPLILFIFPTIFIVTAGPAAMQIGSMFNR